MDKYDKTTLGIIVAVSIVSVAYVILIIAGLFDFYPAFPSIWAGVILPSLARRRRLEREREEQLRSGYSRAYQGE